MKTPAMKDIAGAHDQAIDISNKGDVVKQVNPLKTPPSRRC